MDDMGSHALRRFGFGRRGLEAIPDDPKGWSLLGRTLAQTNDRDAAFDAMNKAEKLGDKTKEMYTLRARLNIDRKNWDQALEDFDRGAPEPEDALRIAQLYVFKGQPARLDVK